MERQVERTEAVRVGAVDIGTNTVRHLVAEVDRDGRLVPVARRSVVTRLGQGVDETRRLHPAAVDRTLAALAEVRAAFRETGCVTVGAVATSAVRDAQDARRFLESAAGALGAAPELISGEVEAALSFRGVASGLGDVGRVLVVDLGGGSTEFVVGDAVVDQAVSVDIGSVRLTERALPRRPAPAEDVARARREAAAAVAEFQLVSTPSTVVGVGGSFTSLAAILLDLPAYDPARVHGSTFEIDDYTEAVRHLATLTSAETETIPSLEPARAPVILGGAIVAEQALARIGADRVTVSVADILDGLALELAERQWVGGD